MKKGIFAPMEISEGLKVFSLLGKGDGLHNTLGMEFLSTPEADTCMARMKVDRRHIQPFGLLNGGATIALAENLAGVGSLALCPGRKCAGMTVCCNHLHPASEGTTVTAVAKVLHRSRRTHVWEVDVRNEDGEEISRITVTNFVFD